MNTLHSLVQKLRDCSSYFGQIEVLPKKNQNKWYTELV